MIMLAELSRTHVAVSLGGRQTGDVDRSSSIQRFVSWHRKSKALLECGERDRSFEARTKLGTCSQSRTNGQIQTIDFISAGPWHSGVCKTENPARAQWHKTVLACTIDMMTRESRKKRTAARIIVAQATAQRHCLLIGHGKGQETRGDDKRQRQGC